MARVFPLAGLLRLRQIQKDQAASDLAVANAHLNESGARQRRARTALGGMPNEATDTNVLYAIAAARASSRSMLAELEALDCEHREVRDQASAEFTAARARSVGLEKLEGRHIDTVLGGELSAEQARLDEIGSARWHPAAEGGAQ
jgi:flagellar FliJ protein